MASNSYIELTFSASLDHSTGYWVIDRPLNAPWQQWQDPDGIKFSDRIDSFSIATLAVTTATVTCTSASATATTAAAAAPTALTPAATAGT